MNRILVGVDGSAAALQWWADLIVVGSRGAGGVPDLRVGGVAMKLIHSSKLPLMVVPPPGL